MTALVHFVAAAGLGVALSASLPSVSLAADTGAASCGQLTFVQRRVVEKADQGMDALRQYVFVTRGTHNLYLMDVALVLDDWRAKARCAEQAATADAKPEQHGATQTGTSQAPVLALTCRSKCPREPWPPRWPPSFPPVFLG